MEKSNIYEATNPVFNTAKMTSFFLSESGNPYAKSIIERTGFDKELAYKSIPGFEQTLFMNLICQDVRYEAVNRQVRAAGNKYVLDFACGFSPRGLELSAEGYTYMGGDLQMVVPVIAPIISELAGENASRIDYSVVDVTDLDSCMAAADKIGKGPITVITEGLMPYLNAVEKKTVFHNIAMILKKYGGCYITPDFNDNKLAFKIASTILGEEALKVIMQTQQQYTKKGDSDTYANMQEPLDEVKNILKEEPMDAQILSFFPEEAWAVSFDLIEDKAKQTACRKAYADGNILVGKYKEKANPSQKNVSKENKEFSINCEVREDEIFFTLTGRLDSLTAPELLESYQAIPGADTLKQVNFELADLEYISSAGLRVLMSIKKKDMERELCLYHTGDMVKEIIETTGFDQILKVM